MASILNDLFCNLCHLQFDKKSVFDIHMSFVHEKTLIINSENLEFTNSEDSEPKHDNEICPKTKQNKIRPCKDIENINLIDNRLDNIKSVHEGIEKFKCDICYYETKWNYILKKHIESVQYL